MKEKDLRQALRAIAFKDIGDSLDRWNEIQARIAVPAPRQRSRQLRFALAVGLATILLLGASSYAYARLSRHDPGMQGVIDAGLDVQVTGTAQASQSKNGIAVTLTSYYADASRLVIDYTVAGLAQYPNLVPIATLVDSQGNVVSSGSRGGGPVDALGTDPRAFEVSFADVRLGIGENDTPQPPDPYLSEASGPFDLQLVVWLGPEGTLAPFRKEQLDAFGSQPGMIGPFTQPFSVFVNQSRTLAVNQTQTINGLAISLAQLEVAPSRTTARLCYDLPDAQDWQLKVTMEEDGVSYESGAWSLVGDKATIGQESRRCVDVSFDAYSPEGAGRTIKIIVSRMQTSVPERGDFWQKVVDGLAAEGIRAIVATTPGAGGVQVLEKPAGMSDEQLQQKMDAVQEQLLPTVTGPWSFEVTLP